MDHLGTLHSRNLGETIHGLDHITYVTTQWSAAVASVFSIYYSVLQVSQHAGCIAYGFFCSSISYYTALV